MTAGSWSRKLKDHLFNPQHESESYKHQIPPHPQCQYFLQQQDSITSTNRATNWGPSLQIAEPTGAKVSFKALYT